MANLTKIHLLVGFFGGGGVARHGLTMNLQKLAHIRRNLTTRNLEDASTGREGFTKKP